MNKKLLLFAVVPLCVGLVVAIGYYAMFSTTFNVLPSIVTDGDLEQDLGDVFDSTTIRGEDSITLTNNAPTERVLTISNDAEEGIEVSYVATLELSLKDTTTWSVIGEPLEVEYTVIGNEFIVTGVPEGYTAIYYKDIVVGLEGRIANPQPAISIIGIGNFPNFDDANIDELADYTQEPDFYNQMKGAKLWLVPTSDITDGNLNWVNMDDYYYELDLIQYNADGEITLYSGASLTITPVYEIGVGVEGLKTITTTVE